MNPVCIRLLARNRSVDGLTSKTIEEGYQD